MSVRWETYCDESYYNMYAIRPVSDNNFKSNMLFHVMTGDEANLLCSVLNSYETCLNAYIERFYDSNNFR
jgi:hypothetical protein